MVKKGDLILLYRDIQHNYLVAADNKKFHTDRGFVDLSDTLGKEFGAQLKTNLGENFYVLRPSLWDLVMKIHRRTQIIYPKDIGTILMKSGIYPGAKAIEAGSGSGALTAALANFVRPEGKVYSYEQREEFHRNAKKNIARYGLSEWVEFKHKKVEENFDERGVDFVFIDIGSPWELIGPAYRALKPAGRFATICPTFEQLTRTVFTLQKEGFTEIEAMEVLLRRILVREGKTRPEQRMPSHTGFLVFAVKIEK